MGPICHYVTAKLVEKRLCEHGIKFNSGGIIANIVPDFEMAHGYDFLRNEDSLLPFIQASIDQIKISKQNHTAIQFLIHYLLDGLSIGQLSSDFWIKNKYGVSQDDIIDLKSEFVFNKVNNIRFTYYTDIDSLLQMYFISMQHTYNLYEAQVRKRDYSFVPKMTRDAIADAASYAVSIILQLEE
jgi:hypothetical protein